MSQTTRTMLIKPIREPYWRLTEPEWLGDCSLNFHIPVRFNLNEYIGGARALSGPDRYVNLYLNYCLVTQSMEMFLVCISDEHEHEAIVEMDGVSKQRFSNMIYRDWRHLLHDERMCYA